MNLWLGPYPSEANAAYHRARSAGLSQVRAMVVGNVASFKDAWTFRRKLAAQVGCSVRTVQRALTQAKMEGLIGIARGKKTETPPGADRPVDCGWSHRWTIGWGKAGELVKQAVTAAKERAIARWLLRKMPSVSPVSTPAPDTLPTGQRPRGVNPNHRAWTAEELDAELARQAVALAERQRPPPT